MDVELLVEVLHVGLHGVGPDVELAGYLPQGHALGHEQEDVLLAGGEPRLMGQLVAFDGQPVLLELACFALCGGLEDDAPLRGRDALLRQKERGDDDEQAGHCGEEQGVGEGVGLEGLHGVAHDAARLGGDEPHGALDGEYPKRAHAVAVRQVAQDGHDQDEQDRVAGQGARVGDESPPGKRALERHERHEHEGNPDSVQQGEVEGRACRLALAPVGRLSVRPAAYLPANERVDDHRPDEGPHPRVHGEWAGEHAAAQTVHEGVHADHGDRLPREREVPLVGGWVRVAGQRGVGPPEAKQGNDGDEAGTDEEPPEGKSLERPEDEAAHRDAGRVVQGDAQGVDASVKLAPEHEDKRDAHTSQNDRGPEEQRGELRREEARKVDAGAPHHAGDAGHNHPGVSVERREPAGEDREQDENARAHEVKERVAVDERHGKGEGDRKGRETDLVVRIERLGPDAEDAHAHEAERDDKDPLPCGFGAGGERAFGVLCDHVRFPPPPVSCIAAALGWL